MALPNPIRIFVYWDREIQYHSGGCPYFTGAAQKTWILKHKISHRIDQKDLQP